MSLHVKYALLFATLTIFGCQDEKTPQVLEENIRGLKTLTVKQPSSESFRHYPSILKPNERSVLSFEISGKLGKNNLSVGQKVTKNEVLLELDKKALQLNVDQALAALEQAKASLTNIEIDLKRHQDLFERKIVTQAEIDKLKTSALVAKAQVKQLEKQLESTQEQLSKSALIAPYDGVITSVKNNSYITVQAGEPIATIFNPNSFEAKVSVSYDVVQLLSVGKQVTIKLADNPNIVLDAVISELASSTDTVSSYPVIVQVLEPTAQLKVGMAVEVTMGFELPQGAGYVIPLSAIITDDPSVLDDSSQQTMPSQVFIYQTSSQTVSKKSVVISGIKDNNVIVTSGLNEGDVIAVAGIPFLSEGQKVKLISDHKEGM